MNIPKILVIALVMGIWGGALPVLAAPTLFQCAIPQSEGIVKVPAPIPKTGEMTITFQRSAGPLTQTAIPFSEVKGATDLIERIVKAIMDESAQRPPKMAAVREQGLDQVDKQLLGPILFVALNPIYRFIVVYDPQDIQVSFETPSAYPITCQALGAGQTIPDFSNITFTSRPKMLYVAFPERVRSGQPQTAAVVFADEDDDVNTVRITYQAQGAEPLSGILGPALTTPPLGIPSPYKPGLKAIQFRFTIECRPRFVPVSSVTMQASAVVRDQKNQESEPIRFTFVCEP